MGSRGLRAVQAEWWSRASSVRFSACSAERAAASMRLPPAAMPRTARPSVSFSYGWAQIPGDATERDELFAIADRRLYEAKKARR